MVFRRQSTDQRMTGSRSGIEHAAEQLLHRRRYPQVWKGHESECYPGDD
jgi:hypothetical protein